MTSLMKWKINLKMYLGYHNFYVELARKKNKIQMPLYCMFSNKLKCVSHKFLHTCSHNKDHFITDVPQYILFENGKRTKLQHVYIHM